MTDSPGPNLEAQDARQILGLLDRSLDMYRAMGAQGDALYGQALSHTLFTFNQQVNRIGIRGTLTGKVAKFKEHALCEMFLFTRIDEADIPGAFVEYVRWRFGLPAEPALHWLKSVLNTAITRLPIERRAKLRRDAMRQKIEWLTLIEPDSWQAPPRNDKITLGGVAV